MKIYKITLILSTSLVLTNCTIFKKKSPKPTYYQPTEVKAPEQSNVVVQPQFVTPEIPEILGSTTEMREEAPVASVPLSTFTDRELEHIKFANYDPFPGSSNSFSIDLNRASKEFTYPLLNGKYSSGYGPRGRGFHSGVDLLNEAGAPIFAAFDGVVRISKPYSGYGNVIVLRHDNGLETVYSHNTKNLVKAGNKVKSGDKIATVGRTGTATTNHLHFEVRILGQTINPMLLINPHNSTLQSGTLIVKRNGSTISASNSKSGVRTPTKPEQPKPEEIQPEQKTTTSAPKQESTTKAQYHTIVSGNTLYSIARKYGTSISTLCRLNNITEKTILSLGRKLRVK